MGSINSVGRKISAETSGIINLNCTDRGTKKTVTRRNLSIEIIATRKQINAGGINQSKLIPFPIKIKEITRKTMPITNAMMTPDIFRAVPACGMLNFIPDIHFG
jgi:hypothetical protein